jgi:hypothetical protein
MNLRSPSKYLTNSKIIGGIGGMTGLAGLVIVYVCVRVVPLDVNVKNCNKLKSNPLIENELIALVKSPATGGFESPGNGEPKIVPVPVVKNVLVVSLLVLIAMADARVVSAGSTGPIGSKVASDASSPLKNPKPPKPLTPTLTEPSPGPLLSI